MKVKIEALCIGQPRPFNGAELSAIGKYPIEGSITVHDIGLEGDMVADTKNHGGYDMAVHQYPLDHYSWWHAQLGGHDLLRSVPAFGENIVAQGLTEHDVHIGDRFRLGSALIEISQPRQPCWKVEHRFGRKGMVKAIIQSARCGWYYRVVEEGRAEAGDTLERVHMGHTKWSVAKTFAALIGCHADKQSLHALAELPQLSSHWQKKAMKKLG